MKQSGRLETNISAQKCELACEVLRSFGTLRFVATGWSMLPTIWPGDTLLVDRASADQVAVGDVVLVSREGRLWAHRLVSTLEDSPTQPWITQGDAMSAPDRPVHDDELVGRVTYLIRAGKCIPVSPKLKIVEELTAKVVRRSVPAARALVYMQRVYLHGVHLHGKLYGSQVEVPSNSVSPPNPVLPCRG